MRSVEMKNRCLLYYGNPVGYRTEQGVVADSMFRREELEDWLARKGLAVRWEDGLCRVWRPCPFPWAASA